jgi:hypothetical protein
LDHVFHHPIRRGGSRGDANPDGSLRQKRLFRGQLGSERFMADLVARADALRGVDME